MEQLCRTCHSEITSDNCIALNDNIVNSARVKSQLLSCVPEMQQDLVKDPVLCSTCVSALHAAYTFKSQCLETEERIRNYFLSTKLSEKSVTFIELYKQVINVSAVCNSLEEENSVKALKIVTGSDWDEDADTKSIISLETFLGNRDINSEDVGNEAIVKVECDLTQFKVEKNVEDDYLASDSEVEKLSLLQLLDESLEITRKHLKNSPFDGNNDLTRSQPGNVSKTTFSSENRCETTEAVESFNSGKEEEYLKKKNLVSDIITNADTNGEDDLEELPTKEYFVKLVRIDDLHRLQTGNALSPTRPENQRGSTDTDPSINAKGQQASNVVIHSGEKPLQCNICEFRTTQRSHLEKHLRTHTGDTFLQCRICEFRATNKYVLTKHMRTHTGEAPFQCSTCDYCSVRKGSLKLHMITHAEEKTFACGICEFRTAHRSSLKNHMRTHTGEKPFQCSVCDFRTTQRGHLQRHVRTHTGVKPFTCTICEFRTAQRGHLKRHLRRMHTGEKAFQCNVCEFRTMHRNYLKRHLRSHTEKKAFQCNNCEFRAKSKYLLTKHMITHTGKAPFQCSTCGYCSIKKSSLITHIGTHTEEKRFGCRICEFRTVYRSSLKIHMRTHTGEKPFQCSVCEYSTANRGYLKTHMRIHTEEKPFACTICKFRTVQKCNLKTHMKSHV